MLLSEYNENDYYPDQSLDGLGFHKKFRKTFKKIRRKVSKTIPLYKQQKKLFDKSKSIQKKIAKKTIKAIKKSPGAKYTKKILSKSFKKQKQLFNKTRAINKKLRRRALKIGMKIPGFKQQRKVFEKSIKLQKKILMKMPGVKRLRSKSFRQSMGKRFLKNALVPGFSLGRKMFAVTKRNAPRMVGAAQISRVMSPVPGIFFDNVTKNWGARKLSYALVKSRKVVERMAAGRRSEVKRSQQQFLNWLEEIDPSLYDQVKSKVDTSRRMMGRTISGLDLGDEFGLGASDMGPPAPAGWGKPKQETSSFWGDIKGTLMNVMQVGVSMKQQRDLYKLQMARAEKGLPPLNADQVSPTIRTQIEIGPNTRNQMFNEIGAGLKNLAVPLAVGAGALIYFTRK